jgi:hypothetical protein
MPTSELPIMMPALSPDSTSQISLETIFKNMFVSSRTKSFTATSPFASSPSMVCAISEL